MTKLKLQGPIVIIGGMGPQASLRFHQLLVEKSRRYHRGQNDEFPYVVHLSLPIPDFISDEHQQAAAVQMLRDVAPLIEQARPSALVLACNTAHLLVSKVPVLQTSAFISMLEVVAHALERDRVQCVGLLASPVTVRTKLYQRILHEQEITTLVPNAQQQVSIEIVIRQIIAGGAGNAQQTRLARVAQSFCARGAQAILLGCTELPLIFDKIQTTVPAYDCLDLYAEAVIARYYLYNGGIR